MRICAPKTDDGKARTDKGENALDTVLRKYCADNTYNAKELLLHTEKSVLEIANECGFKDAAYFSRYFAKTAGVAPKEYRKLSK